jgi:cytochrome c oxidase accessory protein FixG
MNDTSTGSYEYGKLYRSEEKIYPREIKGRFARLRRIAMFVLLGIFYIGPWLRWDERQAVLFDLPARKFYIFGLTLWPQDFIYLALLLIIAAITLFFFTALAGRVWCGFACPQTVWTEAFAWIERAIEGDRAKRIKLDKSPWSFEKIRKKSTKQFLWIALGLYTGYSFVGYFSPIHTLTSDLLSLGEYTVGPARFPSALCQTPLPRPTVHVDVHLVLLAHANPRFPQPQECGR